MKLDSTTKLIVYNLKEKINFTNFNEVQILTYFDFLLILKIDEEKKV